MTPDEERAERMLWETSRSLWPKFADAMAWSPQDEVPSWMSPDQRKWFWREVEDANRRAVMDRAVADARAEMEATFSPWLLRLGSLIGRLSAVGSAVGRRLRFRP